MNAREVVAGHALGSPDGYQNKGVAGRAIQMNVKRRLRENGSCDEYLTRWGEEIMVRREDDAERRASFDRAATVERARMVVPAAGDYIFV